MSWLYTVIFAGLMMSSQGGDTVFSEPVYLDADAPTIEHASHIQDERETFEQTYPLTANGRVRVSNVNGSIAIGVWDRNEVKVEYVKTADTRERLSAVDVKIESRGDAITVETDYKNWNRSTGDNWRSGAKLVVDIKLTVPRGANLNEIETVNGSVNISGITNFAKVSAVNGTIVANGLRGTARLSTVNGEVNAEFDSVDPGSRITLETVNGRVNLQLPSDINATVKADSVNGSISNEFGLPVRKGKYVGRDLHGRIGTGETQIRLNSVNGVLSIKRRIDGRAVSPTVNLLSTQDDEGTIEFTTPEDQMSVPRPPRAPRPPTPPRAPTPPRPPRAPSASVATIEAELTKVQAEVDAAMDESARVSADAIRIAAETLKSEAMRETIRTSIATGMDIGLGSISTTSGGTPVVIKRSNTIKIADKPSVKVKARNCTVVVRSTGNNGEVRYRVTRVAASPRDNDVEVSENVVGSNVSLDVTTADDDQRTRYYDLPTTARIEISVPSSTDLNIQTGGEIRVENIRGRMVLNGRDGNINVRETEGDLAVNSSDGRIRILGHRGNVVANSVDGEITIDGDLKTIDANSEDGDVNLILPSSASATVISHGGELKLDGLRGEVSENDGLRKAIIGGGRDQYTFKTNGSVRVSARSSIAVSYD